MQSGTKVTHPQFFKNSEYSQIYEAILIQNVVALGEFGDAVKDRNDLLKQCEALRDYKEANEGETQLPVGSSDHLSNRNSSPFKKRKTGVGRYPNGRRRHNRRCANEIEKEFFCSYAGCGKTYGSEGSLNLHIK